MTVITESNCKIITDIVLSTTGLQFPLFRSGKKGKLSGDCSRCRYFEQVEAAVSESLICGAVNVSFHGIPVADELICHNF